MDYPNLNNLSQAAVTTTGDLPTAAPIYNPNGPMPDPIVTSQTSVAITAQNAPANSLAGSTPLTPNKPSIIPIVIFSTIILYVGLFFVKGK